QDWLAERSGAAGKAAQRRDGDQRGDATDPARARWRLAGALEVQPQHDPGRQGTQPANGDQMQGRGSGVLAEEGNTAEQATDGQPGVADTEGQQVRALNAAPQLPAPAAYRQHTG